MGNGTLTTAVWTRIATFVMRYLALLLLLLVVGVDPRCISRIVAYWHGENRRRFENGKKKMEFIAHIRNVSMPKPVSSAYDSQTELSG